LRPLATILPEGINSLGEDEWEVIEFAVDSGATETVISDEMVGSVETKPSWASKMGVQYEVANGVKIPNEGEKVFNGLTDEGNPRTIKAQVCDVNKALMSVKKVVAAGNRVIFDDESFIEDKITGERIYLEEKAGMYMLKMWVKSGF
jgi:hypothetical protein